MEYGPGFGEYKVDYESIFERMGRCDGKGVVGKVKSAVVDHGNPSVMHGAKANTAIGCKTDEQVLDGLLGVIPSHQFAFGRFMALANALGCMFRLFIFTKRKFLMFELFLFLQGSHRRLLWIAPLSQQHHPRPSIHLLQLIWPLS